MRFFVAGTGTDVGKTVASAVLCAGLSARYWKPIQTGAEADARFIAGVLGEACILPTRYHFPLAASPDHAARVAGTRILATRLNCPPVSGPIIIEGAGGLFVPLSLRSLLIDLIPRWKAVTILVAKPELGTINHTLLSLAALKGRGLPVAGVLFSRPPSAATRASITRHGRTPIIGHLPELSAFTPATLRAAFCGLDQKLLSKG